MTRPERGTALGEAEVAAALRAGLVADFRDLLRRHALPPGAPDPLSGL